MTAPKPCCPFGAFTFECAIDLWPDRHPGGGASVDLEHIVLLVANLILSAPIPVASPRPGLDCAGRAEQGAGVLEDWPFGLCELAALEMQVRPRQSSQSGLHWPALACTGLHWPASEPVRQSANHGDTGRDTGRDTGLQSAAFTARPSLRAVVESPELGRPRTGLRGWVGLSAGLLRPHDLLLQRCEDFSVKGPSSVSAQTEAAMHGSQPRQPATAASHGSHAPA